MGNFNIKIELDRIPGAKIMDIKGDVATRRCIVIPIDNERGTGPRPSVHRIAPALEDRSEEGRGKRRGQLVGHDLGGN